MAMNIVSKNRGALSKDFQGLYRTNISSRGFYKPNKSEKFVSLTGAYLYTRMPSRFQLVMPSFVLKLVDFPEN